MSVDADFEKYLRGESLVTVRVFYYLPDYQSIINEYLYQTIDVSPRYPRVTGFLNYWRKSITAIIKDIEVSDSKGFSLNRLKKVDFIMSIQ